MDFIGKEIDIRSFFHDFYYESEITHTRSCHQLPSSRLPLPYKKHFFSSYPNVSLGDFSYTLMITLERERLAYRVRNDSSAERTRGIPAFFNYQ